jgi:lysosomal alpha-mannosidase
MEFVWRPFYDHLGERVQIFSHVMYHDYRTPPGLNWDSAGRDDPFIDDPRFETFNADAICAEFFDWIMHMKDHYRTNNLFVTMGEDFNYMNAKQFFTSIDKLIPYFNNKYSNITLLYSTPGMYIDAVNKVDIEWPTKYDDMFPYADNENSFWTGYFSSRANDKEYIRRIS